MTTILKSERRGIIEQIKEELREEIKEELTNQEEEKNKKQRRELWARAWVETASASDCKEPEVATRWADKALEAFDERVSKGTL